MRALGLPQRACGRGRARAVIAAAFVAPGCLAKPRATCCLCRVLSGWDLVLGMRIRWCWPAALLPPVIARLPHRRLIER
jgi:hypothetical protein